MIGGMVSSTILTLIVIRAIYALVKGWRLPAAGCFGHASPISPTWTALAARLMVKCSFAAPGR